MRLKNGIGDEIELTGIRADDKIRNFIVSLKER